MLQERVPNFKLLLNFSEIESRIILAQEKLKTVINYSFTEECRFKFILEYFGEVKKGYQCNKCDNCGTDKNDYETIDYLSEIVLNTFKEFKGGLTVSRLLGILSGKSKSRVAKTVSTYGSCRHYKEQNIEKVLNSLISKEILKELNGKLFFQPIKELIFSEKVDLEHIDDEYESNFS